MDGTFELAEAQRDRFSLKYQVDLPDRDNETALFDRFDSTPGLSPETVDAVVDIETIVAARDQITDIYVSEPVREYILDIVEKTRSDPSIEHGGSPRATLAFLNAGKARAAIHGREYVLPDDIKTLVRPVLIHRLVRNTDARLSDRSTEAILDEISDAVPTPGSEASFEPPSSK
jgi:MoxR-like ATPase